MKKLFIIAMFVGVCGLANATTFSETNNYVTRQNPNGIDVYGNAYNSSFTTAKLLSGTTAFDNTAYTISSADIYVTMLDAKGYWTYLTFGSFTLQLKPTSNYQVLDFTLTMPEYNYIQAADGAFSFSVEADCYLESAALVVNATKTTPKGFPTPDMATTVLLLGSSLLGLEVLRRKFTPAKA